MVLREKDDATYYYTVYRENPTQENLDQLIKYRPQDRYDEISRKIALDEIREESKLKNNKEGKKMSQKLVSKIVWRDPKNLKFDPNQPRKKFDKESIENLGNSLLSQGLINPPEVDKDDVVITGEMRVRAAQLKKIKRIKCSLLVGVDDLERFERQTIENLHHNQFTSEERENAVKKLWESGKYSSQKEMGMKIGLNQRSISRILKAYNIRKELKNEKIPAAGISTRDLSNIGSLSKKEERKKIAQKVVKNEIKPKEVRKVVKVIKELDEKAPELKKEILKPKVKITEEKLNQITEVAKFPEPEWRKEVLKNIKASQKLTEEIIEEKKEIAKGNKPKPVKIIDVDRRTIDYFEGAYKIVSFRMQSYRFKNMGETTKKACYELIRKTRNFLNEQLKLIGKGDVIDA